MDQTVPMDFTNAEDKETLPISNWFPWEFGQRNNGRYNEERLEAILPKSRESCAASEYIYALVD